MSTVFMKSKVRATTGGVQQRRVRITFAIVLTPPGTRRWRSPGGAFAEGGSANVLHTRQGVVGGWSGGSPASRATTPDNPNGFAAASTPIQLYRRRRPSPQDLIASRAVRLGRYEGWPQLRDRRRPTPTTSNLRITGARPDTRRPDRSTL